MDCDTFRRALAEGVPPDAAHRATCPRCAALVAPTPAFTAPVPRVARLRARHQRRVATLAAAVALAAVALWPSSPAPPPDLVAVLAEADSAAELAPDVLEPDLLPAPDPVADLDPLF
ncbi:MAG: hypothetical protein ACOZNI_14140 [Myxococcota bacterium]